MRLSVANELTLTNPTAEIMSYCKKHLILNNPDFVKKQRLGKWVGDTPAKLCLYRVDGDDLILPHGLLKTILEKFGEDIHPIWYLYRTGDSLRRISQYVTEQIPLYDYQEVAVNKLIESEGGVLQSPAGSGKTQMGLATIAKLGYKALWLTHTKDLLNQSRDRAKSYFDKTSFGEITEGRVNIGTSVTFATVQTLAKQDMSLYKDSFDIVVVDECHRVAGTPTMITQFGKVINSLSAKYKYGLSATVHRSDGMIESMFAYLGNVSYIVPDDAVADKVMPVWIYRRDTGIKVSPACLDTDGTLIYQKLISYLTENTVRNFKIAYDLGNNADHYNLILSDRIEHLKSIMALLPEEMCVMIDGSMTSKKGKEQRNKALDDMREGKKHYLFATYRLAKEGLDIPRLDRLYLTTPQKDYAVVVQSVGRIARTFEGKDEPVCYDYVDSMGYTEKAFKKRLSHYRKCGCQLLGGAR